MKKFHKLLSLLLVLVLTTGLLPHPVRAAEDDQIHVTYHYKNPLYYPEAKQTLLSEPRAAIADAATISAAASQLRNAIKARDPECVLEIQTESFDEESFRALVHTIATEAENHTGVPTEGDYIMWQYGEWTSSASGSQSSSGAYSWTITYIYSYYTTAQEEAQVDAKVQQVLNSLNVASASDYEKVKAVYDYICENVTYDHSHLNDTSYKHQFTAYAALVQGTSVCQGYALLFYRLALELGVDARLIAGTSRGEGHGWNIVELGGKYYNADTTWDAGNTSYSYFLKCPSNFPDHTRDAQYDTTAFHNAYPMASSDYQPGTQIECEHSHQATILDATCTEDGLATYTCTKCGETTTEVIEKLGHDYQEVVTEPTCAAGGYTLHICSRCSDSYTDSETAALPHTWDEGTVTQEPTETEPGIMTYECINCDATKTESITCTHTYESATTEPTCTTEGQNVYTCTLCGHSYTETIAKLPHQWDEGTITKEPTATESGEMTQHCANCDNVRITMIPATGNPKELFRIQGDNRYETAFKTADLLKEQLGVEKFGGVVVASGTGFADALSGSYLAAQKQCPMLLVNKYTMEDVANYIRENVTEWGDVYVLGGTSAVSAEFDQMLHGEYDVYRVEGANRYETNLEILDAAGWDGSGICICTGRDFADSLSASALGLPILLVNKSLTDKQIALFENINFENIYIIGGESAISAAVENQLKNYGTVERIKGDNRYETSVNVAKRFWNDDMTKLVLAYGQNFPDGLCGGVLSYFMNAPMILTRDKTASFAADFAVSKGITSGAVLGGTGLISDKTVRQIFSLSSSDPITLR